jgi:hypothetical protein
LLEVDEAQSVDPDKYDREFRPMASSTNATTVLYGTAWGEDSILERQRQLNVAHQLKTGERLHFEYDWHVLAALNERYRDFVAGEIARLGESHPTVQTQYLLHCMPAAGRLFSRQQRTSLQGAHPRERAPKPGITYVAGIDLAGEDEEAEDAHLRALVPRRDSTVVTIAAVGRDAQGEPIVTIVDHVWWTGHDQVWQYDQLVRLWHLWGFAHVCVDASGIGAGIASFLAARFPARAEPFVFTAPSKSALGYAMLAKANTGQLAMYAPDGSPEWRQFWQEVSACRYLLRAGEQLSWSVPPTEGHDDFVISLALCCRAADTLRPPAAGALLRPEPDREAGRW